jgi:hypothetical protein
MHLAVFKRIHWVIPLLFSCLSVTRVVALTEVMPLEDVKIGMEGEWVTVVRGEAPERFRLRVLGVARNFAGPRQPVIICEAIDADQILNGPVAGMSGSPVYIDGKLVGAYAYGYGWPKEQAIIGVTPIEAMTEIVDRFPPMTDAQRYRKSNRMPNPAAPIGHAANNEGDALAFARQAGGTARVESQLPFPVFVAGSPRRCTRGI